MIIRRISPLLVSLLAGCGTIQVTTRGAESNCRRAGEIAATGTPPSEMNLGTVAPPLPDGLDKPRGVIVEPQALPRVIPPDTPTIGFPDPNRRKVVFVSRTRATAEVLRQRFEDALNEAGLKPSGGLTETKIGGKLTEFSFSYEGRDVQGTATVIRCTGSPRVVVSQTLAP